MQPSIRPLTRREFSLFRELVEESTGIHLSEAKQALVHARLLARLRELGLETFTDYYERVVDGARGERTMLINAICTNETHFFREPAQFAWLAQSLVPRWLEEAEHGLRPRRACVWSAACSTGEEPYSVAMALLSLLPPEWRVEVLATDLSTKALGKASLAVYPMTRLGDIPDELRRRYLLRGVGGQDGKFRVGGDVRRVVELRHENLMDEPSCAVSRFDLVLCRNVLMYFRPETRRAVVERLVQRIAPAGYLWVGHSESLHGFDARLATVIPTVYRRRQGAA
jgi:chemotaxis protein methyltransferase CheR